MAAAHVAGAACLVWSYAPVLSYAEVKDFILSSVDVIPALQGKTVTGGRLNVNNMLTLVTAVDPDQVSAHFALHANRPNPFNPSTTISYELATRDHASLRVYDVRGALVRTLFDGDRASGEGSIVWDGRDDDGAYVASGVYFYRLTSGDFARTRKMVLLK
jgi:hypothetical protein